MASNNRGGGGQYTYAGGPGGGYMMYPHYSSGHSGIMGGWGSGGGGSGRNQPPPPMEQQLMEDEDRTDLLRIILYELNAAIAPRKARLRAIRAALSEFDHNDAALHDEELDVQADRILYQKLALAYAVSRGSDGVVAGYPSSSSSSGGGGPRNTSHNQGDDADEELELIATALEMVYRASRSMVALSFTEVGRSMLPLCIEMIGDPNPKPREKNLVTAEDIDGEEDDSDEEDEDEEDEDKEDENAQDAQSGAGDLDEGEEDSGTEEKKSGGGGDGDEKKNNASAVDTLQTSATSSTMESTLVDGGGSRDSEQNNGSNNNNVAKNTQAAVVESLGTTMDIPPYENSKQTASAKRSGGTKTDRPPFAAADAHQETAYGDGADSSDSDQSLDLKKLAVSTPSAPAAAAKKPEVVSSEDDIQDNVSEISDNVGIGLPVHGSAALSKQIAGGNVPFSSVQTSNNADGDAKSKKARAAAFHRHRGTTASKRNLGSTYADEIDADEDLYVGWARRQDSSDDDDNEEEKEEAGGGATKKDEDADLEDSKQRKIRFWDDPSVGGGGGTKSTLNDNTSAAAAAASSLPDFEDDEGKINNVATGKIVKILRYYSRVLSAMSPMAHQQGLLDALVYQMGRRLATYKRRTDVDFEGNIERDDDEDSDDREGGIVDLGLIEQQRKLLDAEVAPIRVDATATLVNLACAEENKKLMLEHPGLLEAVLGVANYDHSEEAREHGAIVLMNLAYSEDNKVAMGSDEEVLSTLGSLATDPSPFTRRYATAALFTLACVLENARYIACHGNGFILSALSSVLLDDPVEEARINASEACFNMAKNASQSSDDDDDSSTVLALGNHASLLPALAHAVMADSNADVRTYAARSLEWLATDIHHGMPCHDNLLRALTKSSLWTKTSCIVEALSAQAMISENRQSMIQHDGLLDALASLALLEDIADDEVRSCAISTLVELSKEESYREVMAKNEGVMTALTHATFLKSNYNQGPRIASKTKIALKNLANALKEN